MSSLLALRAAGEANSAEQKRNMEKKRNMIVLVHHYLIENGYIQAAERFQSETCGVVQKFEVADNVDIGLILNDFETYYEMRFDRKPKLVRKVSEEENSSRSRSSKHSASQSNNSSNVGNSSRTASKENKKNETSTGKLPSVSGATSGIQEINEESMFIGVQGVSLGGSSVSYSSSQDHKKVDIEDVERLENRILKPPPQFGNDSEMRQLASIISREIYQESPNIRFEDIVRLDEAKRLLCEAVQLPLRFPSVFTGILRPWRGILLHGPPGTGKVLSNIIRMYLLISIISLIKSILYVDDVGQGGRY